MAGYIDASRPPGIVSADYNPRHKLLEAPRSIQLGWARRRRIDRVARKEEVGRSRTVDRLAKLGSAWKVLDVEELGVPTRNTLLTIGKHVPSHPRDAYYQTNPPTRNPSKMSNLARKH